MKSLSAIVVAAAMIAIAAPVSAQKIDLSTIKCKDFVEGPKDSIGYIMMWLDGYYTGEDDPPIVDFDAMKAKGEKLGEYCAKNPTSGLITAAEEVMSK